MPRQEHEPPTQRAWATPTAILVFFATVWWVVGLSSAGHPPELVYPLPLLVAAAVGLAAWRRTRLDRSAPQVAADAVDQARRNRLVAWASGAEGLALFVVAGVVLPSTGHRDATVSAIALIVGAHFVPLARGLPAPTYYVTAVALVALGLAGFGISDVNARITTVSAGAAIVLWLTAATVLRRAARHRGPAAGSAR